MPMSPIFFNFSSESPHWKRNFCEKKFWIEQNANFFYEFLKPTFVWYTPSADRESAGSPCDVVSGTLVAMALVFTWRKWRQCSDASFGYFLVSYPDIRWSPGKISLKFIWIWGHVFLNLRHNSFVTETKLIPVVCQNGGKFSRLKTFIKNSRFVQIKIFFRRSSFFNVDFHLKN